MELADIGGSVLCFFLAKQPMYLLVGGPIHFAVPRDNEWVTILFSSAGMNTMCNEEITPMLQAWNRARGGKVTTIGPVICPYKGGRFTYIGAYSGWKRGCQRARKAYEDDCEERGTVPDPQHWIGLHFHDLRAKALTDLKRLKGAATAQALAGHTTEGRRGRLFPAPSGFTTGTRLRQSCAACGCAACQVRWCAAAPSPSHQFAGAGRPAPGRTGPPCPAA